MNAGKGDRPRNNWSKKFRNNFDQIDWKNVPTRRALTEEPQCLDEVRRLVAAESLSSKVFTTASVAILGARDYEELIAWFKGQQWRGTVYNPGAEIQLYGLNVFRCNSRERFVAVGSNPASGYRSH